MIQPEQILEIERQIHVAVRSVRRDGTTVLKSEVRRLVGHMHELGYDWLAVEVSIRRFVTELQRGLADAARRRGRKPAARRQQLSMRAEVDLIAAATFARLAKRTRSIG
jgi:hypothetical protein